MRTIIAWIILTIALTSNLFAQPDSLWSRTFGGERDEKCYSMLQAPDGGFVLGGFGEVISMQDKDFFMVKTDSCGDSLWSCAFGGYYIDECHSVLLTLDGGYALAGTGRTSFEESNDFWLIKIDADGDSVWGGIYGGDATEYCESVQQTTDGGYVLAGISNSYGSGWTDFWLVRTDVNGDSLWSRTFGGNFDDWCYSVAQTSDGGFILAGYTDSYGSGGRNFWLVKTDADGDSLWARSYGGEGTESCSAVLQTNDGGYLLTGSTTSYGAGERDFWLIKVDVDGDSLWSRTYGGEESELCYDIKQTEDGGYLLAGNTQSFGAGQSDFWLLKVDASGDSLWSRTFGGGADEYCYTLAPTDDGGFAMAGYTWSFGAGRSDFWLVKVGPDPTVPLPPGPFERLQPTDSSLLQSDLELEFVWTASVDPNDDNVSYIFQLESPTFPNDYFSPSDTITNDTTVTVTFEMFLDNLDDLHDFYWTVYAVAGGDTIDASNGEGFFTKFIIESTDEDIPLPTEYNLSVYPNPFNPSTTISFDVPQQTQASITIYDLLGREIAQLVNGTITAGIHSVNWNGSACATGIYLIELKADNYRKVTKAMLLR